MISDIFIEQWRKNVNWQTSEQVEQDLIISKTLIDLYNHPHIKKALVFRGGTALNKLFIKPPLRYSEDIDLVQKKAEPIGQTIDVIRKILKPWLGNPKTKITNKSSKLIYKYENKDHSFSKLKLEINTTEHFQVLPLRTENFAMKSGWFTGQAELLTYEINELMATKLRALYQRRKGRDLFDLWFLANKDLIDLNLLVEIFKKYCEYNKVKISSKEFIKNLEQKKYNRDFKADMNVLLPSKIAWNFEEAYQFVIDNIVSKLP